MANGKNRIRNFFQFRKSTIGQRLGYNISLWKAQAWQYIVDVQFLDLTEKTEIYISS